MVLLLAGLGLVTGYLLRLPDLDVANRVAADDLTPESGCDPSRGPCRASGAGMGIRFGMGPGVRPLAPFPIRVEVGDAKLDSVLVAFSMRDMDMGINRFRLVSDDGLHWTGQGLIPVCSAGRRDWTATVFLDQGDRRHRAVFGFQVAAGP
jgi:hypothetical protein